MNDMSLSASIIGDFNSGFSTEENAERNDVSVENVMAEINAYMEWTHEGNNE